MFHAVFDRASYPEYVAAYSESLSLLGELVGGNPALAARGETAQELIWSCIHGITELGLAGRLREGVKAQLEPLFHAAVAALTVGIESRPKGRSAARGSSRPKKNPNG